MNCIVIRINSMTLVLLTKQRTAINGVYLNAMLNIKLLKWDLDKDFMYLVGITTFEVCVCGGGGARAFNMACNVTIFYILHLLVLKTQNIKYCNINT